MSKQDKMSHTTENSVSEMDIFKNSITSLEEITAIQCANGNWNYDSYMHGMANGMILALAMFKDGQPEFLEKPDVWLSDMPHKETRAIASVEITTAK